MKKFLWSSLNLLDYVTNKDGEIYLIFQQRNCQIKLWRREVHYESKKDNYHIVFKFTDNLSGGIGKTDDLILYYTGDYDRINSSLRQKFYYLWEYNTQKVNLRNIFRSQDFKDMTEMGKELEQRKIISVLFQEKLNTWLKLLDLIKIELI